MGKQRIIAETGAGQHGVATATACALLGLDCIVYMGVEDIRRQQPNVQRMELLGATVAPVEAGTGTLKEAVSEAIRDWVTNVETTHYIIGSAVGPAPYPAIVRDLQRVIGDEARAQILEREGRLPDRVVACVGGGSNAIGMFAGSSATRASRSSASRPRATGIDTPRHGAPLTVGGTPGVLHGSLSAILQDEDGQISEAHSICAGLDYPGSGPEHAWLRDTGRATYVAVTDEDALAAFRERHALEGIIPALETAHALHHVARTSRRTRPRRRLPVGPRRQGPRRGPGAGGGAVSTVDPQAANSANEGAQRIAAAFAAAPGARGAHALPDGRLPDVERSRAVGEAYADGGADLVELGVPFSDPLADGPVIHAAGTRGAARRGDDGRRARGLRRPGGARPGGGHVLREPRARARRRRRSRGGWPTRARAA